MLRTRGGLCKYGHSLANAFQQDGYLKCRECNRERVRKRRGTIPGGFGTKRGRPRKTRA